MPRTLTLKPVHLAGRPKPWMIRVPPYLSESGKTERRFFRTQREAQTAAELVRTRADNFGRSLSSLSPSKIALAAKAFELLGERPEVALLEVLQDGLAHQQKRNASVPWSTLVEEFIATKQTRSPQHRQNLHYTRERFASLAAHKASEITPEELARLLPISPSSKNLQVRHLKSVFNYGKKRGWLSDNPAEKLDLAERPRREVECFSVSQVRALFDYALEHDPALLPFFTFGFFCGVRPVGEMQKLDWSNVHFDGAKPEVEIPPSVSKTKRRRFVDLNETALAWINAYRSAGGKTEGSLVAYTPAVLRKKRRQALVSTGVRWIQQGMRHSFCSAWLARHHDVNRLVLMSGHDDPETMWRFYHRGMSQKEAAKYWAILPPDVSKIVAFHASA